MANGDEACSRLAARQHGVLSLEQARRGGLSDDAVRRRVSSGRWARVRPGVFRMAGSPISWLQQLKAATLWAGAGAAVSHRTAAALWGMDGFSPGKVEITVQRSASPRASPMIVHRSSKLKVRERIEISGIPVTSAERTLLDLGSVVSIDRVEEALECCLRRRWGSHASLRELLSLCHSGRRGTAALRTLLHRQGSHVIATESLLETRLLKLLRVAGLPLPERQVEVREGGRLIARLDFAYPVERVALEADGETHHLRRARWEQDHIRRNALIARGWLCLVVTWARVHKDPRGVASEVRDALIARSLLQIPR